MSQDCVVWVWDFELSQDCVVWDFELCNCVACVYDVEANHKPYPFPLFLTELEGANY